MPKAAVAGEVKTGGNGEKRKRTAWTKEQKLEIVREVVEAGPGQGARIAKKYEIAPNLLYRWVDALKDEITPSDNPGTTNTDPATVEAIRAEINRLKMKLADMVLDEK